MKKAFLIAVVAILSLTLKAASITEVKIVQLWPWSTDVKITYKLSSVEGPVDVQLKCYDGKREIVAPNLHNAVSGDMYGITTGGEKKIILKPQKAFAASIGSYANFNVKLTVSATPANGSEVVYKIFDLNGKSCENVTRNDLKNGKYGDYETDFSRIGEGFDTVLKDVIIWTAVTNGTTYKKDKLVMRKIPVAGEDKLWTIGSPVGECGRDYNDEGGRETQHTVKLTEDYFIGVFEITQSQALKVWNIPTF